MVTLFLLPGNKHTFPAVLQQHLVFDWLYVGVGGYAHIREGMLSSAVRVLGAKPGGGLV